MFGKIDVARAGQGNPVGPWRMAVASCVAVLLITLLPGAVGAQGSRIERPLDHSVKLDSKIAHYGLIGIGDLTGDGRDDMLFQGVLRPVSHSSTRWVELVPGPGPTADFGGTTFPVTTFNVSRGSTSLSTTVADFNADGIADLVVTEGSRRGIEPVERQKISITFGREEWDPYYFIGEASRGDRKIENKMTLTPEKHRTFASRLTVRGADINGDGHLDLIMAADPPQPEGGEAFDPPDPAEGESEILIMFGDSEWVFRQEADPALGREAGWADRGVFRVDVRISGLGFCARSLGDIADVTGDGKLDLLVRRCPGGTLPDLPGVVSGREDWPSDITVNGAIVEEAVMPAPVRTDPGADIVPLPDGLADRLLDHDALHGLAPLALDTTAAGLDYLRQPEPPRGLMAAAPPLLGRDVSGDGVADLLLASGSDIHVWLGGPDIGAGLLTGRSDRIYLGASLAGAALSDAWGPADLDDDGEPELLLARHVEPVADDDDPEVLTPAGPLYIFDGDWQERAVLDLLRDSPPPRATWQGQNLGLAGMADIDGDGRTDVLVQSDPAGDSAFLGGLLGPLFLR